MDQGMPTPVLKLLPTALLIEGIMPVFLTSALFAIYALMTIFTVKAGEEDCLGTWGQPPIRCYECSTNDPSHYCSDPFNATHPDAHTVICKEYCVKWTRTALSGKIYVERTCSSNLKINMRKDVVCIQESRPSTGQICFCEKEECNGATLSSTSFSLLTLSAFLASFHVLFRRLGLFSVL